MTKWYHVKAYKKADGWGYLPIQSAHHVTRNILSAYLKYIIYKIKYDIVELKEEIDDGSWNDC